MSTFEFGYVPALLSVNLTRGSDFVQTLSTVDGSPWPAGAAITLRIADQAWPAVISGSTASWNVDHTLVDALTGPAVARLVYSDGTGTDLTWMTGKVVWRG